MMLNARMHRFGEEEEEEEGIMYAPHLWVKRVPQGFRARRVRGTHGQPPAETLEQGF